MPHIWPSDLRYPAVSSGIRPKSGHKKTGLSVSYCPCISLSLYLTVFVSRFLCISLSLYLAISVSRCLYISLSLYITVFVSHCLCVSLSLYLTVSVSRFLCISLSLYITVSLSRCLSISKISCISAYSSITIGSLYLAFHVCWTEEFFLVPAEGFLILLYPGNIRRGYT